MILLVANFIISICVNETVNDEITDLLGLGLREDVNLFNFLDYALLSHLPGLTFKFTLSDYSFGMIKINGGLLLSLLVPLSKDM